MEKKKEFVVDGTIVNPLQDGQYKGIIKEIYRDNAEYDYTNYVFTVDGKDDMTLKIGFPSKVTFMPDGTPSSNHAKFLKQMGIELKEGKLEIGSLLNKRVSYLVVQKKTNKGTFSEIVKDSVKLI